MRRIIWLAVPAVVLAGPADDPALRARAQAALRKAVEFYSARVATEGAYHFAYTEDLTYGRSEITASVDVYNLPGLDNEVSEYVVAGSRFRTPTATQPPRTVLAGVRVTF